MSEVDGERIVVLEVRDLSVSYGKVDALHGLTLKVHRGEIVTVIGPNGAGKTTLLCALIGLLPARGEIVYLGERQGAGRRVEKLVRQGMTLVPEKRELFAEMSVEDNLLLGAFDRYRAGHRDQLETIDQVFDIFPRLMERREQRAATLSGGERQMLAMGRALMAKPRLLLLDEPSSGLNVEETDDMAFWIQDIVHELGVTVLMVEHDMGLVSRVSDRVVALNQGEVLAMGTPAEVQADARVAEAYLGSIEDVSSLRRQA